MPRTRCEAQSPTPGTSTRSLRAAKAALVDVFPPLLALAYAGPEIARVLRERCSPGRWRQGSVCAGPVAGSGVPEKSQGPGFQRRGDDVLQFLV